MSSIKLATAVVIHNLQNPDQVLAVLRPSDDESLPNVWGLPAVMMMPGELPEEAAHRVGREKLATEIEPLSLLGIQEDKRETYQLILLDIVSSLVGDEPDVSRASTNGVKYVAQQWTSDYRLFVDGAKKGSVCDRIFLKSVGIDWED